MIKQTFFSLLAVVLYCISLGAEPNGAVLYRNGKRLGYHKVSPTAEHHYFGYLEGPAWENKYSAFRYYIDKDDRNAIDIIGKYKEEAILQYFVDTTVDEHAGWPWGTDIFKINSSAGLGSFRLFANNSWLNPQLPENLDSLVVTILDSSVQTPSVQIGYHGWNIGSGNKVTVLWKISTAISERPTRCELSITGNYTGKVVIAMTNHRDNTGNPNRSSVQLIQDQDPPLLASLGRQGGLQEGFADSLLLAVFAEKSYFDSFVNDGTVNYGMVLKPDADKKVRWSFAYSWAREANPLFRSNNWKQQLTGATRLSGDAKNIGVSARRGGEISTNGSTRECFSLAGRSIGTQKSVLATDHRPMTGLLVVRDQGKRARVILNGR
jgi:hypothetical protein